MATKNRHEFTVIHPLDDKPEQKVDMDRLGPMAMTRAVRCSLLVLRAYMVLMFVLVLYHVAGLAGILGAHN